MKRNSSHACPKCGGKRTGVIDSRYRKSYGRIARRRRRMCKLKKCSHRWTTYEIEASYYKSLTKPHEEVIEKIREALTNIAGEL